MIKAPFRNQLKSSLPISQVISDVPKVFDILNITLETIKPIYLPCNVKRVIRKQYAIRASDSSVS